MLETGDWVFSTGFRVLVVWSIEFLVGNPLLSICHSIFIIPNSPPKAGKFSPSFCLES